jgi:hypothetical protein
MMVDDRELVAVMREEGLRRVLVGGNGVSVEPRALSAAGFDVVAVDISPLALKAAQHFELAGDRLASFVGDGAEGTGGRLTFLEGDLFEPTFCAGPYDVDHRTTHGAGISRK